MSGHTSPLRAPSWGQLQTLAMKHGAWVPGYGPFAVELLATYGAAPKDQPHWVGPWMQALEQEQGRGFPAPRMDAGTPGLWHVRKREVDGKLRDCFVAAPDCQGLAYDAEILGDDEYRGTAEDPDAGMRRKLADCELIVAAVNSYRATINDAIRRLKIHGALENLLGLLEARYTHTGVPACPECGVGASDYEVMQLVRLVRQSMAEALESKPATAALVEVHERARAQACTHNAAHGQSVVHATGTAESGMA